MVGEIYWIDRFLDGSLAIMPAPGLLDNLEADVVYWQSEGIELVVSLLTESEFAGLTKAESGLCESYGIEFVSFPIRDKSLPESPLEFIQLVRYLSSELMAGRVLALHCRAGIGRSTVLAACILTYLKIPPDVALDMIADARGIEVPETEAQRQWVLGFPETIRLFQKEQRS